MPLVVDDEEMLKELVSMGLKMIGWEVQSAGDGPAALAIARDWRPDVLVLDIMMARFRRSGTVGPHPEVLPRSALPLLDRERFGG